MELILSEFKARNKLHLNYLNKVYCASTVKDCIAVWIKKGDKIPEIFVKSLILNNPELIEVQLKDSVPQLTKDQQKKYGIDIAGEIQKKKEAEPKTTKEVVDKQFPKWDMEKLNVKLGKLHSKEFKIWCEKEFGEEKIDKRKTSDSIIINILKLQDEGKL